MDDRFIPVFLVAFARWALPLNSRRKMSLAGRLVFQLNVSDFPCAGLFLSSGEVSRVVTYYLSNDLNGLP
jgi:hypothetical protein